MRAVAVAVALLMMTIHTGGQEPVKFVSAIELPGVEGRIDHLGFDPSTGRLYVAALGNNTVEVIDVRAGTHLKSLPGFHEPQGIAAVPDAKAVAIANGQGEGLQLIDSDDYHPKVMVSLGDDSDNVRYDASAKRIYVGFGSGALAAITPADAKVVSQVKLTGHPESFQLERSSSRIFVNVPTAEQIAVVDRAGMRVTTTWPVTTAKFELPDGARRSQSSPVHRMPSPGQGPHL